MKDMLNEPLEIGDIIAFPTPNFRGISIGKITGFTEKRIRVMQLKPYSFKQNKIIVASESLKLEKTNPAYVEMILLK